MGDINWGPATDFMEGLGIFLLNMLKGFQDICYYIFTYRNLPLWQYSKGEEKHLISNGFIDEYFWKHHRFLSF